MENKIDQFFKDKLGGHTLPPSEDAWTKVEANTSKKNSIVGWRIAAAILITGALISVIAWSQLDSKNNELILAAKKSKNNSSKENPAPQISQVEKKTNSNPPKSELSLTSKKPSVKSLPPSPRFVSRQTESKSNQKESDENKTWSVKTPSTAKVVDENKSPFTAAFVETSAVKKASRDKEKLNTEATPSATIASTKRKPIKLEFTLEEFSIEQPVATVSEEKNSGLKRVWNLALEVKNGDGPVHEMKNELFAFSFKKNKNQ